MSDQKCHRQHTTQIRPKTRNMGFKLKVVTTKMSKTDQLNAGVADRLRRGTGHKISKFANKKKQRKS